MPKFTWDIDPALFHLGSYELRYYSLIFVVVFLGGYQLLRAQIMRGGGEERDASDFFVYGVLAVLIGARLGHVVFYDYAKALEDPLWVLRIWTGGLSSHGAVVGLAVAMWLYTKRRGISFLEGADRFALAAALGATLVRVGNFFNSEIVGRATDQTWGVSFPRYDHGVETLYRHPSQLYEALLGILVFAVLFAVDKKLGERRPRGLMISLFFVIYFTGRFGIEFFKELQVPALETEKLTMGQMLSLPCALLGLAGVFISLKKRVPAGWVPDDDFDDDDFDDEDEPGADHETVSKNTPRNLPQKSSTRATDGLHLDRDADVDAEFSRDLNASRAAPQDQEPKKTD